MRPRARAAQLALAAGVAGLFLATSAGADGVVVRGESLVVGAAERALAVGDGRIVDLSRLIEASAKGPPYDAGTLVVFDLERRTTRRGDATVARRGLLDVAGGATYLGALLDEPGDVLFYESSPTGPDDLAYAERFVLIDAFDGRKRFLSDPRFPVPEPSIGVLLVAGLTALAAGALRSRRRARR